MNQTEWPEWLQELQPDDVTSARLHGSIMRAAEPLLAERRDEWWDVASRGAGLLIPVAAALALVFGGVAIRGAPEADALGLAALEPTPDVVELLRAESTPAGFSEFDTNDDVVFAALGEAARRDVRP